MIVYYYLLLLYTITYYYYMLLLLLYTIVYSRGRASAARARELPKPQTEGMLGEY